MKKGTHPFQQIQSLSGDYMNLLQSQMITLNQQESSIRQQATGNFQNVLNAGGSIDIPLRKNAGHGWCKNCVLRMDITNSSSGSIRFMPFSHFFDRIDILLPNGSRVQTLYTENLLHDLKNMDSKQAKYWLEHMNSSKYFGISDDIIVDGDSRTFYLPLTGNFIENTNLFAPIVEGEIIFRLHINPYTQTLISGSITNVTVTRLELELSSPFILQSEFAQALQSYRSIQHDHRYNYPIRQKYTTTISASDTVDILLSGFNGLFRNLQFFYRAAGSTLRDVFEYQKIDRFTILDSNLQDVLGGNDQYDAEDSLDFADRYSSNFRKYHNAYNYDFGAAPISDAQNGTITGYYPFSGSETLRLYINPAVQHKVITLSSSGTPAAGSFRWVYKNEKSDWLAYDANAAANAAAIAALPSFYRNNTTVTVSAAAIDDGVTITFGNSQKLEALEPMELLYVEPDASFVETFDSSITTYYKPGHDSSGSYEIIITAHQFATLSTMPNGELIIRSS
jgi:hypothetical protein